MHGLFCTAISVGRAQHDVRSLYTIVLDPRALSCSRNAGGPLCRVSIHPVPCRLSLHLNMVSTLNPGARCFLPPHVTPQTWRSCSFMTAVAVAVAVVKFLFGKAANRQQTTNDDGNTDDTTNVQPTNQTNVATKGIKFYCTVWLYQTFTKVSNTLVTVRTE